MAKIHYRIKLPFDLCRASGADKEAHDFIYDQRLLGLETRPDGDDIVVFGTNSNLAPPLAEIEAAVAKGGYFEGIRVCGLLKDNEFDTEVPLEFPDRIQVIDEVESVKTWTEWLASSGSTPTTSLDGTEMIFKLTIRGRYLNSDELTSILETSTLIDFDVYSTMLTSPEYQEVV